MPRWIALVALFFATGCSGGGTLDTPGSVATFAPTPTPAVTATPTPPAAASLTLGQSGAMPTQGLAGTFVLSLAVYAANKTLVTGAYAQPITLTTNDSTDLTFAVSDPRGASVGSGSSATILDSTASVVVSYSGSAVPAGTQISAYAPGAGTITLPFAPVAGSGASSSVASLAIAQTGALPIQGSPGQFALTVTAFDATGTPISGIYATPVVVTTNDVTDVSLATSLGVAGASAVTLLNSQTPVFVTYSGAHPPNGTQFGATAGSISASVAFVTSTGSQLSSISRLDLKRVSTKPLSTYGGASAVYVSAYDQSGNLIGGTLPSAVTVTINDDCDIALSIGSSIPVTSACGQNPSSVTINDPAQAVYVNYLPNASTDVGVALSASTAGNVCSAVTFPGNSEIACSAVASQASLRRGNRR